MRLKETIIGLSLGLLACKAAPPPASEPEVTTARAQNPLPKPTQLKDAPTDANLLAQIQEGSRFYGVYLNGVKVGHSSSLETLVTEGGQRYVEIRERVELQVAHSADRRVTTESRFRYLAQAPYPLEWAETKMEAAGSLDHARIERVGEARYLFSKGVNLSQRKEVSSRNTLADQWMLRGAELKQWQPGRTHQAHLFALDRGHDLAWKTELEHWDTEGALRVATLKSEAGMGLTLRSRVREDGILISQSMSMGLEMRLESEGDARAQIQGLDVMSLGVTLPQSLGASHEVSHLGLKLAFPKDFELPVHQGQALLDAELKGEEWVRSIALRAGPLSEVTDEERQVALKPDTHVDSTHPDIVALAHRLKEQHPDPQAFVKAVVDFVFQTLRKELASHIPQASEVLARATGDCTEHTWLASALLRAGGVAARPVYGLAYTGGRRMEYHAWVEYEKDGHWHRLEPTWGLTEPGAGYLMLGSEPSEMAGVIGSLRFVAFLPSEAMATP